MSTDQEALFGFDGAFLRKLERLALMNRRPLPGPSMGPRRSPRHGASVEFADFRDYADGDDFRRIDWNAYARLDRLFLRLYSAEEMTTVTIFLDRSRSMDFGEPSKALVSAQLAAIFSFIALHNYDRVAIAGWADKIHSYLPAQSGKATIPAVWRHIAAMPPAGKARTDAAALYEHGRYGHGPGLSIVLSDLLTDSDWRSGLLALQRGGSEVSVVQVLAREELEPDVRGDWKLVDAESGAEVEVTISPRVIRRYQEELTAHVEAIKVFCRRHGMAFLQVPTHISITDAVIGSLRTVGILA